MDNWSYEELKEYIHEDIAEFMVDGLNIRQVSSRVQVEYKNSIGNNQVEKAIIYLVLCDEGIKNELLREDIKIDTINLLDHIDNDLLSKELLPSELEKFIFYKEKIIKNLRGDD